MKSIFIKILLGLNFMLWPVLRFDTRLPDGESLAISGFPVPWVASSVMGTGDVHVSVIIFLLDLVIFLGMIQVLGRIFFAKPPRNDATKIIVLSFLALAALPPFIALASRLALGDWSGFVILPWEGWGWKIESVYLTHGLASFGPVAPR